MAKIDWRLGLFFLLALAVRLYRINAPLADWHSWRQADTASVSWRYLQEGIDLLHPRYHDLSSIPSGRDNPEGYRMVEFPLFNALHVYLYRVIRVFALVGFDAAGRLVSIGWSLIGAYFLFRLVKEKIGDKTAGVVMVFYLFLPFNIYYQRTILPENLLTAAYLSFLWLFSRWIDARKRPHQAVYGVLATVSLSAALLTKPTAVFFILPAGVWIWQKYGWTMFRQLALYFMFGFSFLVFFVWRWWIGHFPAGIPAFTWLLNGNGIRFKPSFFRWIFGDRIGRLMMGYWGTLFLGLSLTKIANHKNAPWILFWVAGMLLYLFTFATGNVQHDYYQIVIMPVIALMAGIGLIVFWSLWTNNKIMAVIATGTMAAFAMAFSWFFVRDWFNINHPEIVAAGQEADRLLPAGAKVIAPYNGDTAFLYQTKRNGWPIGGGVEDKVRMGAKYYISVNMDEETNQLIDRCQIVVQTDQYVIIDLNKCPSKQV